MNWHKIEDKEPPIETVIVCTTENYVGEAGRDDRGDWWWANSEGEYWADTIESNFGQVTHWMPLPSPPEDT